jgi:hypothetical protein
MLPALVYEEHCHDETDQKEGERDSKKDYDIDFLVLTLHKNAIVNDKYNKIFNETNMVNRFSRMTSGSTFNRLVDPYTGKVHV